MSNRLRVYRDPVHTNIEFDRKSVVGRLAIELIDTPELQRMRHVRQLALANLVYHGAEHSRFSHSLGVMHLAARFYRVAAMNSGMEVDERTLALVVASAALHDIGHPPFSHAVEKVVGVDHEETTAFLIRGDTKAHATLLRHFDGQFVDEVAAHVLGESDAQTASIVSSQLDADRMDYVLRDGYYAGVPNSRFDLERVLQFASFDSDGVVFHAGSQTAIEGYFIARYHLYLQLYYHKTTRAAEVLLRSIIRRAYVLVSKGATAEDLDVDIALVRMLENKTPTASVELTDHDLWSAFRRWKRHDDRILADLASRLLARRLFKVLDMSVLEVSEQVGLLTAIKDECSRIGLDPDYYVVVDEAKDTPYKVVDVSAGNDPHISIRVRSDQGIYSLEHSSGLTKSLQQEAYRKVRICFPEEVRDFVNKYQRQSLPGG